MNCRTGLEIESRSAWLYWSQEQLLVSPSLINEPYNTQSKHIRVLREFPGVSHYYQDNFH